MFEAPVVSIEVIKSFIANANHNKSKFMQVLFPLSCWRHLSVPLNCQCSIPTHSFVKTYVYERTHSAANDFWGKTFLDLTGEKKMNQNLSILTGCSAGATVSHPYGATRNNVSYFLFTGKLRCCAVRARENQVSQLISIY